MAKNKVVFIAGASRGIGLSAAKKFASNGWSVAGFYNQKEGPKVKNISWYHLEISDYSSIKKSFEKAFEDLGRVDCFVNCVGIFGYKSLIEYDEQLLDKVISVNEKGAYLSTKEVLNKMVKGSIVYISSTAAQIGSTDPIYAGTKSAILGLTKSMAKALAPAIRVNCVAPGVTNSDMTKNMRPERLQQLIGMSLLKRIAEPEDIANAIYFLASDEAKHITGVCLDVNAGYVLR
ncbi:MAG: SDR family oxidoreductase [Candidatus Colwellbacteria bacterium]|nr:SDR family oxidoreductase [Candidatus Colwellbacteria bacterium]